MALRKRVTAGQIDQDLLRSDFAVLRKWIGEAQEREQELLNEIESLKSQLIAAKASELEAARHDQETIVALGQENSQLKKKIIDIRASRTFQIGVALKGARRFKGLIALPKRILRLIFKKNKQE